MAEQIWKECYAEILSTEQIDFMLERFQSVEAITRQVEQEGFSYFLISDSELGDVGFCGISIQEDRMYLSKIYLRQEARSRGLFSMMLKRLLEIADQNSLSTIWLTVNRENLRAIERYEHLGFRSVRTQVAEIGNGFVMDDFIMELPVKKSV